MTLSRPFGRPIGPPRSSPSSPPSSATASASTCSFQLLCSSPSLSPSLCLSRTRFPLLHDSVHLHISSSHVFAHTVSEDHEAKENKKKQLYIEKKWLTADLLGLNVTLSSYVSFSLLLINRHHQYSKLTCLHLTLGQSFWD